MKERYKDDKILQKNDKGAKKKVQTNLKAKLASLGAILAIVLVVVALVWGEQSRNKRMLNPEIARSMTYDKVEKGKDEKIEGTDFVTFDAFFLRDLDGDGEAEGIRGSSREIGKQDTIYMELNVLTKGYLKDGVITVNNNNFYLQTAIPKDNEIKESVIGNNIKEIKLNDIKNGTQKLLTGIIRSGDYSYSSTKASAIGNDISKYSKTNSITLTGTHVAEDGTETPIVKTVNFQVDWHGSVKTSITNVNQQRDINQAIKESTEELNLSFSVTTQETEQQLNIKKSVVEGTIPSFNGYMPTKVTTSNSGVTFNYDEKTGNFTIGKEAEVNQETKVITNAVGRENKYNLTVTYPLEAYTSLGSESITLKIPVTSYHEGYNNPNTEFKNPEKSNIAKETIVVTYSKPKPVEQAANFSITVGKYMSRPTGRYIVSKEKPLKIYNEIAESQEKDTYVVQWYGTTGTEGNTTGMIMKKTKNGEAQVVDEFIKADSSKVSMNDVTHSIGIYFSNPTSMLGEDGEIKVYDDETDELLVTFTKENWSNYTSNSPYYYETPVKHIRVETSSTKASTSLTVYNLKELDDEVITHNYTREEFDNLQYIQSTLNGYLGGNHIATRTHRANYEAPYTIVEIAVNKTTISTQETEKNMNITLKANADENANQQKWLNGVFLIKLPEDIIDVEIKNITATNGIKILSYEQVKIEGVNYIKINTKNRGPNPNNLPSRCSL